MIGAGRRSTSGCPRAIAHHTRGSTPRAMPVILHALPPSANSASCRAFLMASGIDFAEEMCYGKTRTPEFIAKFPTNLAPALEHDGVCISENNAIGRYLAAVFPDKAGKFYPRDDPAKCARIDMVAEFISYSLYPLGFPLYHGDVANLACTKDKTKESQEEAAAGLLEMLEAKIVGLFLKDTTFLLSDKPTLADFRLAPILLFARVAVKLPQRLEAYLDEMEKVPGYKEAVEYGGHGPKPFTDDKKRT
eukprot:Tamp_24644.p1 GENE.Tamp_24644~~Tamp_24644.p1  ORF type:complete len:248 (+),score=56.56 Tamp_24644:100-843(+)